MIHWRRHRTHSLIRLWDKDFTFIGTLRSVECVEPWWRWVRRLSGDIAAVIRARWQGLTPAHTSTDDALTGHRFERAAKYLVADADRSRLRAVR